MTHLPSWAVPGRKVVCVDASPHGPQAVHLTHKSIYTIDRVEWFHWANGVVGYGVHLLELPRPFVRSLGSRAPWGITRFRPVVTLEDDMLTFRSLLVTTDAPTDMEITQ